VVFIFHTMVLTFFYSIIPIGTATNEEEEAGAEGREEGVLIYLHMGVDAEAKELKLVRRGGREGGRGGWKDG